MSCSGERRAAPRKRKTISADTPSGGAEGGKIAPFLSKLVQLVRQCPPEVGGWCEDGMSFIVCDELASTTVIPQFFAHTNFRSFCRQLSCCGNQCQGVRGHRGAKTARRSKTTVAGI